MSDTPLEIRKKKRLERSSLSLDTKARLDQAIFQHLIHWPVYQSAQHIALYQALPEEVSLKGLLSHAQGLNQSCYVPMTPPDSQGLLTFAHMGPNAPTRRNRYGIEEPLPPHDLLAIGQLDLMLLPLVAFDRQGHRIGMGAGYYDRSLAPFAHAPTPIRVGIAYGLQEVTAITPEPWDIPCHYFLTEHGIISCVV